MPDTINKKPISLDKVLNSKSLKEKSTSELERILQTLLCDDSDNDVTVNSIIAELMKRGISKDEIQKAFDIFDDAVVIKINSNKI